MSRLAETTMPWSVTLPGATVRIAFEPADPGKHAVLVHDWMNRPHVVPWWQLDRPLDGIRAYLSELTYLQPWVVSTDGVPFGYLETYRVQDDPLARCYPARQDDLGWHVLVGPPELLGAGPPRLLGRAVLAYLFEQGAERVVCEPDTRNARMIAFCQRLGCEHRGEIDLPEKRAALMVCEPEAFAARFPGDRAAVRGAR